jgi:hypothetical protein
MHPLISLFNDVNEELEFVLKEEIKMAKDRNVAGLSDMFPIKMSLYKKIDSIAISLEQNLPSFTRQEHSFLKNSFQKLDELAQDNLFVLKGLMISTQKIIDILISASKQVQGSLKVYDRGARFGDDDAALGYRSL